MDGQGGAEEILWEVADCGEAMDCARDLGEGDIQLCARVCVCVFLIKPADLLSGHMNRRLKLRLERQESLQKDFEWRREAHKLGGTVAGWSEPEQQLQLISVHHRSVHSLSSAQHHSVHKLSRLYQTGSD